MKLEPPRKLVLVEDDETFARTLLRSLERRGYQVALARSPGELDTLLETHGDSAREAHGRHRAHHRQR